MDELILSKNDFKAFSSDTRAKIAKLLCERNHTLAELSKKLGMASPTVKTHLDKLAGADIVEQHDEGRKWKYYSLTRKGKRLLEPESQPAIMIVIGISAVVLVGTIFLLSQSMPGIGIEKLQAGLGAPSYSVSQSQAQKDLTGAAAVPAQGAQKDLTETASTPSPSAASELPGLVFIAIMAAFVLGYFVSRARAGKGKQR